MATQRTMTSRDNPSKRFIASIPSSPRPSRSQSRPRTVKSQMSTPDFSRARSTAPQSFSQPLPPQRGRQSPPLRPQLSSGRTSYDKPRPSRVNQSPPRSSHYASSSISSIGSSLFDRRKQSYDSYTSMEETSSDTSHKPREWSISSYKSRVQGQDGEVERQPAIVAGYGAAIWNRVAAVAGALSVNVGKAWETGVVLYDGEVTPTGEESRLTKAMKAYHLKQARSPSDLPTWLFDENERRVKKEERWASHSRESNESKSNGRDDKAQVTSGRSRGLRDIYDQAATSSSETTNYISRDMNKERSGYGGTGGTPSKATSRLQAIRDAKRNASGMAERSRQLQRGDVPDDVFYEMQYPKRASPVTLPAAPRIGLPSRPRQVR